MKGDISIKIADGGFSVQEKYKGKHVAIIDGKVAGWGATVVEALNMAQEKKPKVKTEKILLRFIPQQDPLIL